MEYKEFCEKIAREAGKIMRENFLKTDKEWKEDDTPITFADKKINRIVIEAIHKEFPKHDVIGEEESSLENKSEYVWVCDPIDGTIAFSHGIPTSVFSLALVKKGEPIMGVVYDPWIDRMYFAEKGKGCFLNNKQIHVNRNEQLNLSVMGISTWKNAPYDLSPLELVLRDEGVKLLRIGSIIYASMLVASGEMSAVFFAGKSAHDGAAIKIIVEEAGGKVTDIYGNEQRYDSQIKGYIASNKIIHNELIKTVSEIVKKKSAVIWFTGLPSSGKSTIAEKLKKELETRGKKVFVIDGDIIRATQHKHLSFSREDIRENNKLIAELSKNKLNEFDFILVPIVSPYKEDRKMARSVLGEGFIELFINASLKKCIERDVKGLYKKALAGEISDYFGVPGSINPYEPPENPEIEINTENNQLEECINKIISYLNLG
ncbi:MAG: adenylyl-sulfate kinase [archaeon]